MSFLSGGFLINVSFPHSTFRPSRRRLDGASTREFVQKSAPRGPPPSPSGVPYRPRMFPTRHEKNRATTEAWTRSVTGWPYHRDASLSVARKAKSVTAGHVTTTQPSAPRERFGRLLWPPKATQKEARPKRNVRPYTEPYHPPPLKL